MEKSKKAKGVSKSMLRVEREKGKASSYRPTKPGVCTSVRECTEQGTQGKGKYSVLLKG